jgi:polysaccharide export outer membrane protein
MKPILLCFAFSLSVGLVGCSTFATKESSEPKYPVASQEPQAKVFLIGLNTQLTEVPYLKGLTLVGAIAHAGGLAEFELTRVRVIRGNKTLVINLKKVIADPSENIPLEPGDVIKAVRRVIW